MADDLISAGTSQLAQPGEGGGGIASLNDFLDVKKLAPPGDISGLQGGLTDMGSKFKDLGAKFKDSGAAQNMLNNMEVPDVPNFDGQFSSLKDMMNQHKSTLDSMSLGANAIPGSGPLASVGVPSMSDFVGPVAGCPEIDDLISQGVTEETLPVAGCPEIDDLISQGVTEETLTGIENMIARSGELFQSAGIDLDAAPVSQTLSSYMTAATSLHKIGAEANGAGSADMIKNMIPSGSPFGDSIKVALAEGKNNKLMAANGISPPQFNPFEGLPAGGDADISTANAQKIMGGGS
jgi:hypothetical protein